MLNQHRYLEIHCSRACIMVFDLFSCHALLLRTPDMKVAFFLHILPLSGIYCPPKNWIFFGFK